MKVISHYSKEDWGDHYVFMEEHGFCSAGAYTFNDDKKTLYLESLSVSEGHRNKGLGTEMQVIRESLAKKLQCENVILWVKKGTWMRKWYKRRGYEYYRPKKKENAVWLKKIL